MIFLGPHRSGATGALMSQLCHRFQGWRTKTWKIFSDALGDLVIWFVQKGRAFEKNNGATRKKTRGGQKKTDLEIKWSYPSALWKSKKERRIHCQSCFACSLRNDVIASKTSVDRNASYWKMMGHYFWPAWRVSFFSIPRGFVANRVFGIENSLG